jgi:hypothetical protein
MLFSLFRVAMGFIEDIRVHAECLEAGFGAEIDRPAAIFKAREIRGISFAEFPPAERYETRELLLPGRIGWHAFSASV